MEAENTSALCLYMNTNFPPSLDEDCSVANSRISAHFWDLYKVYVKNEKDLFLFKWDKRYIHECRGYILRRASLKWEIASRPFDKFFNQNEGSSPVKDDPSFNELCSQFSFVEKADGSCIQLWWDLNTWRTSTLKMITPDDWVPALFWKIISKSKLDNLDKNYTYLFELCCNENRVVTQYETDEAFLVASRNKSDGTYITSREEQQKIIESIAIGKIVLPQKFEFVQLGITNLRQAKDWIEGQSKREDIYGKNPEGFVAYWKGAPLCKLKNKSYVQKHGIVTGNVFSTKKSYKKGDLLFVRNITIDRFFADTLDDVTDVLTHPAILEFLEELRKKVEDLITEIESVRTQVFFKGAEKYLSQIKNNPKLYVDFVDGKSGFLNDKVPKNYRSFFLLYREQVVDVNTIIGPIFYEWLRKNYVKFNGLWKNTKVKELNETEIKMHGSKKDWD